MALPVLLPMAVQAGTGIYQAMKGAKMANEANLPKTEISQEVRDILTDAEIQAAGGIPAEQEQTFRTNVERATQLGMKGASDRKAGIAGLPGMVQSQADAYNQFLGQDVAQRQANQGKLQSARGMMAGERDRVFQANEMQPYLDKVTAAEAMKGAGMQNVMGALQAGSKSAQDKKIYEMFMGGGFNAPSTTTAPNINPYNMGSEVPQGIVPNAEQGFLGGMNPELLQYLQGSGVVG